MKKQSKHYCSRCGAQWEHDPTAHECPPVSYTIHVDHFHNGNLHITVSDIGCSDSDRKAVVRALRKAADELMNGKPMSVN